jgi:hypothetical protein
MVKTVTTVEASDIDTKNNPIHRFLMSCNALTLLFSMSKPDSEEQASAILNELIAAQVNMAESAGITILSNDTLGAGA